MLTVLNITFYIRLQSVLCYFCILRFDREVSFTLRSKFMRRNPQFPIKPEKCDTLRDFVPFYCGQVYYLKQVREPATRRGVLHGKRSKMRSKLKYNFWLYLQLWFLPLISLFIAWRNIRRCTARNTAKFGSVLRVRGSSFIPIWNVTIR